MNDYVIPPKESIQAIRFAGDRAGAEALLSDDDVSGMAATLRKKAGHDASRRRLLATGLRVTDRIMPNLVRLVHKAKEILHINDHTVEVYVYNDPNLNASCIYYGSGPIFVCFSSGIIEKFTDEELMFVIGHEFGHAIYEHHILPTYGLMSMDPQVPPEMALKLMSWSRDAEISADRAGMLACQDTAIANRALIKLSCGLNEPHVEFNVDEYMDQMSDFETLSQSTRDMADCYSSHPFNPIRVVAMNHFAASQLLGEALGRSDFTISTEDMDARINEVMAVMEPETEAELMDLERDCLLWCAYWVAAADGRIETVEVESIKEMCPAESVAAAREAIRGSKTPISFIGEKAEEACAKALRLASQERCAMLQKLIVVARADNVIDEGEKDVLHRICGLMDVDPTFVDQILMFLE
jgi:uncharacterized tellurite resistance protein B-like protein